MQLPAPQNVEGAQVSPHSNVNKTTSGFEFSNPNVNKATPGFGNFSIHNDTDLSLYHTPKTVYPLFNHKSGKSATTQPRVKNSKYFNFGRANLTPPSKRKRHWSPPIMRVTDVSPITILTPHIPVGKTTTTISVNTEIITITTTPHTSVDNLITRLFTSQISPPTPMVQSPMHTTADQIHARLFGSIISPTLSSSTPLTLRQKRAALRSLLQDIDHILEDESFVSIHNTGFHSEHPIPTTSNNASNLPGTPSSAPNINNTCLTTVHLRPITSPLVIDQAAHNTRSVRFDDNVLRVAFNTA
jgi:hypothetical protein